MVKEKMLCRDGHKGQREKAATFLLPIRQLSSNATGSDQDKQGIQEN